MQKSAASQRLVLRNSIRSFIQRRNLSHCNGRAKVKKCSISNEEGLLKRTVPSIDFALKG